MGAVLVEILPVIIATVAVPVTLIIVLLILSAEGGTVKAAAFVFGVFTMRLVHGLIFGFVLAPAPDDPAGQGMSWLLAGLLIVLGTLMLVSALRALLTEEDPDAPPPRWMAMLDGLSTGTAFLMGFGLTAIAVKMWLFSLAVVTAIRAAGLSTTEGVIVFLIYDLLGISLIGLPVLAAALAPAWADRNLDRLSAWMERHNKAITITVALVFGFLFLYKGITGLAG